MRKERLASFRKKLVEKQRQLVDEVGRTATYGKDQEDDSIKDLGDQASNRLQPRIPLRAGQRRPPAAAGRRAALQKIDDGSFGDCERCGETIGDKRLEALPFARYCIDCQRLVEEEERTAAG